MIQGGFDEIILATGVNPRIPEIPGVDRPNVLTYVDVVLRGKPVGKRVAVVGAGGIGFDVTEFITEGHKPTSSDPAAFMDEWGVDMKIQTSGGLKPRQIETNGRTVYLLKRSRNKFGSTLGKTTGWVHKQAMDDRNVTKINGVVYESIDDRGLTISVKDEKQTLAVDTIILCAGQEPRRDLLNDLKAAGESVHLIGGADLAAELDAKRAIDQGARLAARL